MPLLSNSSLTKKILRITLVASAFSGGFTIEAAHLPMEKEMEGSASPNYQITQITKFNSTAHTSAQLKLPCTIHATIDAKGSVESTMALWGERVWNAKAKAGPRASVLKLCLDARAC